MDRNSPVVTVGIPTFNRPELLERALTSLARQSFSRFKVSISDNASLDQSAEEVAAKFQTSIPNLEFIRQEKNIGPRANLQFLLDRASTPYFMWLADDDELSPEFIESTISMLEAHRDVVTVFGSWFLLDSPTLGRLVPTMDYKAPGALARVVSYVREPNDVFFYGVHRTAALRTATFTGFSWPNAETLLNWAYVYLLDLVIEGKVVAHPDPHVRFINHAYSQKHYSFSEGAFGKATARRLNVYGLMIAKVYRRLGVWSAMVISTIAITAMLSRWRSRGRSL